jgi:hypothetical protein
MQIGITKDTNIVLVGKLAKCFIGILFSSISPQTFRNAERQEYHSYRRIVGFARSEYKLGLPGAPNS